MTDEGRRMPPECERLYSQFHRPDPPCTIYCSEQSIYDLAQEGPEYLREQEIARLGMISEAPAL